MGGTRHLPRQFESKTNPKNLQMRATFPVRDGASEAAREYVSIENERGRSFKKMLHNLKIVLLLSFS